MDRKVALITGASSGIGRSIARELAKNGIEVVINFSKSESKAKEVKDEIISAGGRAHIVQADITVPSEVVRLFEFVSTQFSVLDILVNNAGVYIPDFIETHDISNWDKVLSLNLRSKLLCTKYAVPLLKKSLMPRIINIATRGAVNPMEESAAYCCAASAIVMLTKISALELSKYNIKVNSVSPGLTRTPMTEAVDTENEFENYATRNPSKRIGLPKDIANMVAFLVSDDADFVNGENINVSGGIVLV